MDANKTVVLHNEIYTNTHMHTANTNTHTHTDRQTTFNMAGDKELTYEPHMTSIFINFFIHSSILAPDICNFLPGNKLKAAQL